MPTPARGFLANPLPLPHAPAGVGGEREQALAEDPIVFGKAKNRGLQVRDKCSSLKLLHLPVEGVKEFGGELPRGRSASPIRSFMNHLPASLGCERDKGRIAASPGGTQEAGCPPSRCRGPFSFDCHDLLACISW